MTNAECLIIVCQRYLFAGILFPSLVIFNLSAVIFLPSLAQTKGMSINADQVSYEQGQNIVDARGSVEVVYNGVLVNGAHIIYNKALERIMAADGFVLYYKGITIEGETLDYYTKTATGKAADVKFLYAGINLKGGEINFSEDDFHLKQASFSTCDLEQPHYHVTASDINLYPKYGWLVAYWGFFWLDRFPLVPVPTYIYDVQAEKHHSKNLPPFPEVSSNHEDGWYINECLAWHIRRELSGTYSLNYATKKGLGLGGEANYIVNETNSGNARLYYNGVNGLYGGLTHAYEFGPELPDDNHDPLLFFPLPKQRRFELDTTLSYNERINYERVSYFPGLVLRSRQGRLFNNELTYDAECNLAALSELSTTSLLKASGAGLVYKNLPEKPLGILTPFLTIDARFYSNGDDWLKSIIGIDLKKKFSDNLLAKFGYQHYLLVQGASPFNFEMYRFQPHDRLTADCTYSLGSVGLGFSLSYLVNTWVPEDIDYSLTLARHCYNLIAKYRSLRQEFSLGFSLN